MKKLILASIALVSLIIGGSANAADLAMKPTYKGPPPAVAPAPVYNWTGFYIGGGFGYGMFNIDDSVSELGRLVSANETWGGRGWFGTVVGGFDYQFANPFFSNPIVAGVFADADFANIKGSVGSTFVEGSARISERSAWAFGARIGYLVFPAMLTYFNGGFSQAHFSGNEILSFGLDHSGIIFPAQTFNGWFLGSGIEYMIYPGLFVKTEYRLADYQQKNVAAPGSDYIFTVHPFVQTIRSELTYRFNWGKAPFVGKEPVVARY